MREVKDFAAQHGQPIETDDFASSDTAKTAVKALIGEKLLEQEVKKYDDKVDDAQVDKYIHAVAAGQAHERCGIPRATTGERDELR